MSTLSEDEMLRPLFEEPTDDIEREDAWDEPLGFLVGGMANTSLWRLGEQYFDAAFVLTESIRHHQSEDYRLANPTLFLYRHAIELLLKAAMQGTTKTHRLEELANAFIAYANREFAVDVPKWITSYIKELAMIDPGSTAFRFSENRDKTTKQDCAMDGEFHVNLYHLQRVMGALESYLFDMLPAAHQHP